MEAFDKDRDEVIKRGLNQGLAYMLTVGTEEQYFETVIDLIDRYPCVYGAIGVHPHSSKDFGDKTRERIFEYLKREKIVAYGEIGLDFFRNYSPRDSQIMAFREQLQIAHEADLPVIIHSRSAKEETLSILKEIGVGKAGGVIHCYSYDLDAAKRFLDLGFYISIPGTITYNNQQQSVEVVKYLPMDRILSETDAPFLTPQPHRGKRNEPAFVRHTVEKIAQVRQDDIEEVTRRIQENFVRLFLHNGKGGSS